MSPIKLATTGLVTIFALGMVFGSFFTVGQAERAVITKFGAVVDVAGPGLHWKTPFITGAYKIPTDDKSLAFDQVPTYSRDQQPASLTFSVNYRLDGSKAEEIFTQYGGEDGIQSRLIERKSIEKIKNVFGQYTAVSAIQDRAKLNADVTEAIRAAVDGPVIILSVQIENIDFSDAYEQSIEDRMKAEVEVQKVRQNAEREKATAEITVTKAKAEADAKLAQAKAAAEATRMQGDAEAAAIRARGDALKDNPSIIALTTAERWNGVLPASMVPGSAVPFVNVK